MQAITGYIFLLGGIALAVGQIAALLNGLFSDSEKRIQGLNDLASALVAEVPAAAVALAFTWFGTYVLGWGVGPPSA